jgi:Ser/Thr protein kinase RdoA (MazF antagonist)
MGTAIASQLGRRLAALHQTAVPSVATLTLPDLRAQVAQAVQLLQPVEPAWRPLLQRLSQRLDAGAAALAAEPLVTLHGDLHARNILLDGAQLAFIDLDSVCRGPAVLELGGWVADLLYRATLAGAPPPRTRVGADAFLAAYAQAAGRAAPPALLAWSVAHQLLCKRAYRCVANLKPGRFEAVPRLLALADAIAGAGSLGPLAAQTMEAA